jgi:hypothetical protein
MIIIVYFHPNTSGLVCAKNLHKWSEKAFASSTLVFHDLCHTLNLSCLSTVVQIHRAARRFPLLNVPCNSLAGGARQIFCSSELLVRAARLSCTMDWHDRGNAALEVHEVVQGAFNVHHDPHAQGQAHKEV